VEKVIKSARKVGDTKTKTNPIAAWFRDRFIGFLSVSKLNNSTGFMVGPIPTRIIPNYSQMR
jgi:hypothetical protein